jgi:hypothetical protein
MTKTPEISATLFNSVFDNKTDKSVKLSNFDALERVLYKLSEREITSKKEADLISPAVYNGGTRANANVIEWGGWCAVDVDDYVFEGKLEDALTKYTRNWRFVCYSTASSTSSVPKFRLIFPLKRTLSNAEISSFNFALQKALGGIGDEQTKDLARMYYIPATYFNAHNFIFSRDGDFIDPEDLMKEFPYAQKSNSSNFFDRLPDEIQRQIIEHRKNGMDNTNVVWSSYRDCPFFPRKLEAEYRAISNTGWYHKMYQIMVAVASSAIKKKYPITSNEISVMCRQLDSETGNWYQNRPIDKEADRALEYVYKNM